MEFNEIMAADIAALNNGQKDFIILHRSIMASGNAAYASAVQMARGLKEMRDTKKYISGGFETFENYAEKACGLKQRQAYNYISFVENLSNEFLQTSAKLGVSKLIALATMDAKDRNDLIAEHGEELETMSTREMDKLKREYESRIEQIRIDFDAKIKAKEQEIDDINDEKVALGDHYSTIINDKIVLKCEIDDLKKKAEDEKAKLKRELEALKNEPNDGDKESRERLTLLEEEKQALKKEIDELKNAPPKLDEKYVLELDKKKEEIKKLKAAKLAAEKAKSDAEKAAVEAKEIADKELASAIEKEREAIKALEKDLAIERARLEKEAKKAKIAANPELSDFKARLSIWNALGGELVDKLLKMEAENAEKCGNAMTAVLDKLAGIAKLNSEAKK